jgi:hypothetical protein
MVNPPGGEVRIDILELNDGGEFLAVESDAGPE